MKKVNRGNQDEQEIFISGEDYYESEDKKHPGFGTTSKDMNPYPSVKRSRLEGGVDNVTSGDDKLVKKFRDD